MKKRPKKSKKGSSSQKKKVRRPSDPRKYPAPGYDEKNPGTKFNKFCVENSHT